MQSHWIVTIISPHLYPPKWVHWGEPFDGRNPLLYSWTNFVQPKQSRKKNFIELSFHFIHTFPPIFEWMGKPRNETSSLWYAFVHSISRTCLLLRFRMKKRKTGKTNPSFYRFVVGVSVLNGARGTSLSLSSLIQPSEKGFHLQFNLFTFN